MDTLLVLTILSCILLMILHDCASYRAMNRWTKRSIGVQSSRTIDLNLRSKLGKKIQASCLYMKSKDSQRDEKAIEEEFEDSEEAPQASAAGDSEAESADSAESEEEVEEEDTISEEDLLNEFKVTLNETSIQDAINTTEILDPQAKAIADLEAKLQQEVDNLKARVSIERINEGKLRDKISESGKVGFYMVQAKVTDFQVKTFEQCHDNTLKILTLGG